MTLFRRTLLRLLAALGVLVLLVTFTPFVFWWSTLLAGPWNDPKGDVLILLGGASEADGMLARSSYLRSVYAVRAWRQGGFRKVVVCGLDPGPSMRDYLLYAGIPSAAIVWENRSHSTRENALFSAELLRHEPGRKILLTSDFHMFRARRAFHKAGLFVEPRPLPDGRKRYSAFSQRWPVFVDLIEETVKLAYYRARGWI